jgi:hypothetical protein
VAGLNLTLADAVLKDDYQGPVRKQINDEVLLLAQVTKNTKDFHGRRAVIPLHMSRNTGVGSRLENEVLPEAGFQGTVDQLVPLHYHYGRVRFTRQVISRMQSDRSAFVRAVRFEMDNLKTDEARDQNRQVWSTSDGRVAQCGTTTAANLVVLNALTPEQMLVNFAEKGYRVDIGTVANPQAVAANRAITAVDIANKTITIDGGAVTTASTHYIFRAGNGGSGANQRELTGIQSIVSDTGALFGVDPANYFQWASLAERNGGTLRPFAPNLFTKGIMRTGNRSGSKDMVVIASDGVYRHIANYLQAMQRAVNTLDLKGGHKALSISATGREYGLAADRDAPVNTMWGISLKDLVEFVEEDWQWEDMDGSVLQRSPDQTHTFEAIHFKFSELATYRRNSHIVWADMQED